VVLSISLIAAVAEGHRVFFDDLYFPSTDENLTEADPHAVDQEGNPVPIDLRVGIGGTIRVIVEDTLGCKATIGVVSASTFIRVTPERSDGPVARQVFLVSASDDDAIDQQDVPLVIGWEGDGETIVVDGDEVVCDEAHQAQFRLTFVSSYEDPPPVDESPSAETSTGRPGLPCGPSIIAPMLCACGVLSLSRRRRR
jgi:hypothetical protein